MSPSSWELANIGSRYQMILFTGYFGFQLGLYMPPDWIIGEHVVLGPPVCQDFFIVYLAEKWYNKWLYSVIIFQRTSPWHFLKLERFWILTLTYKYKLSESNNTTAFHSDSFCIFHYALWEPRSADHKNNILLSQHHQPYKLPL